MNVTIDEPRPRVIHVVLDGRLDLAGAEKAEVQLSTVLAARPDAVIVDLGKVTFMASVGLRLLMTSGKSLAKAGAAMRLINPDETARTILKSTAIDKVLPVLDGLDIALSSLS